MHLKLGAYLDSKEKLELLIYAMCNKNTAPLGITIFKTQHKGDKLF